MDFLCPQKAMIVEVDGITHDPDKDAARDANLQELGYRVMRVTNDDVLQNLDGVLADIEHLANSLPNRWNNTNPSPSGRGE